ncbi:MAG: TonB-dependent receptor [Myxococcota bacterium]
MSQTPALAAGPPTGEQIDDAERVTRPPQLLSQVTLSYPQQALADGLHGDVRVRVFVDANRQITGVKVLSGLEVFHEEAISAANRLTFSPALLDGEPADGSAVIFFHFAPPELSGVPGDGPGESMVVEAPSADQTDTHSRQTLDADDLADGSGQGLADTLVDEVPGMSRARGSTAAAKPIIRGQSERRLLLLDDGVRHESQKWGPDHAPEIDPFSAGEISVIKGAAGARYGPDAIGGVLLVSPPQMRQEDGVGGRALLMGASNGRSGYGALRLDGASGNFSARLEGNYARSAALSSPNYVLGNTASEQWNVGGSVQWRRDDVKVRLSYKHYDFRAGVFYGIMNSTPAAFEAQLEQERPPTADLWTTTYEIDRPYQDVTHDRVTLHTVVPGERGVLEGVYAFQINLRREFEQVRDTVTGPQYDFTLRTHSLDLVAKHNPWAAGEDTALDGTSLEGGIGLQGLFQENVYRGYSLLPNYRSFGGGIFAFERLRGYDWAVEAGARYDHLSRAAFLDENDYNRHISRDTLQAEDCEFVGERYRCPLDYNTGSVSLGGLWQAMPGTLDVKLDLSSASRFPNADELYLIGYAPSFPVFAQGAPDLEVETTWGASPTVALQTGWLDAEVSGYANLINNYIYFAPEIGPSGEPSFDVTIRGTFPRYVYAPIDATFTGVDGFIEVGPYSPVALRLQGSIVRAVDRDNGDFLIGTPPDQLRSSLKLRPSPRGAMEEPELSLNVDAVAKQTRTDLNADFAPPPDGFVLFGVSAKTRLRLGEKVFRFGVEVNNLFNTIYREYTSLTRYYADQPGRDVQLRLGLDF